ncbi:MAG TPA: addiction module protein [Gallionella sp.]|nr:addiction module protein [Gallionella sp.]
MKQSKQIAWSRFRSRADSNRKAPLTEAQVTELDCRLADHLANPEDVIPWSEVKAAALAKFRRLPVGRIRR